MHNDEQKPFEHSDEIGIYCYDWWDWSHQITIRRLFVM